MSAPTLHRTAAQAIAWTKIPDALRSLWRACLPDEGGDVARSLTANFVAVTAAAQLDGLRASLDRLQQRTPCRAFVVAIDEAAEDHAAHVSATTRCHGTVRDIVLEQIELRVRPAEFAAMPGLIRPLLVNDVPNHLYWGTDWPADARGFDAVRALCEHTIVDSRRFEDPARGLAAIAERRSQAGRITDLSWLRLRPWRRAIAEAFERCALPAGSAVEIVVSHGKAGEAAAQLYADYLSQRLGATVRRTPAGDDTAPVPHKVELRSGELHVAVEAQERRLVVHVTTAAECLLPFTVTASRGADGDLLAAAIDAG